MRTILAPRWRLGWHGFQQVDSSHSELSARNSEFDIATESKGVGVARHKIAEGNLVFDCLQTLFQRCHHFAPINCSNKTFDIRTPLMQARGSGPQGSPCSIQLPERRFRVPGSSTHPAKG